MTNLLQVNDWRPIFEDSKSLKKRNRLNCLVPNKQGGAGYSYLMGLPNGEALYGAFHALILLLSKQPSDIRNGFLTIDGTQAGVRYDVNYIAEKTMFKPETIREMLNEVVKNIGWISNLTKPEDMVAVTYPMKSPNNIFLKMAADYHAAVDKPYDPQFAPHAREKLNNEGAIVLDTLHNEFGWPVERIEALLAWMPTNTFWKTRGANLSTMLKMNSGNPKAVSAMEVMEIERGKGYLSQTQMYKIMDNEGLSTDDFESMGVVGGEMQWRRR
jgi:hypothetical protein